MIERGVGCTQRDWTVLDVIQEHTASLGYAPTVREICDVLRVKSTSAAWGCLSRLEQAGYIRRGGGPRDIEVIALPKHMSVCPTCGRRSL